MRAIVQRVAEAWVDVAGRRVAAIGEGLVVLVGVTHGDSADHAVALARKTHSLRILRGELGLMDVPNAEVVVVSQFTLYGDARKGRRPSWSAASPAEVAEPLVDAFVGELRTLGAAVQTGVFGADMRVGIVNDGPMTVSLEVDPEGTERGR